MCLCVVMCCVVVCVGRLCGVVMWCVVCYELAFYCSVVYAHI